MSHFITISLVGLMEKKMVFGVVRLHTSLAVITTENKAAVRERRRDKGQMMRSEEGKREQRVI